MDWSVVFQIVVGAILASAFVAFVEYSRKPKLGLKIGDTEDATWTDKPASRARWLRVKVENKQLPRWAKWLSRNAALHCHGLITFYHLDGQKIFGRSMQARWVSVREPLPSQIVDIEGRPKGFIVDPVRLAPEIHRDIYPVWPEQLDVVVRFDNDVECYGWCNDNYRSKPLWRNPAWKLGQNRYLVKVEVISTGESCVGLFRLSNDGPVDAFRLESAQPDDYKAVFKKS
jgi:hypothetical protein